MIFNPDIHHRRSIRLIGYDYSSEGAYFITICAWDREHMFGIIDDHTVIMNDTGRMVETVWNGLPERFPQLILDQYVVMPNHFHGILVISDHNRVDTLGQIIRVFKSISAIAVNNILRRTGQPVWQRDYYERIIRSERELVDIREYINGNPAQWTEDPENRTPGLVHP